MIAKNSATNSSLSSKSKSAAAASNSRLVNKWSDCQVNKWNMSQIKSIFDEIINDIIANHYKFTRSYQNDILYFSLISVAAVAQLASFISMKISPFEKNLTLHSICFVVSFVLCVFFFLYFYFLSHDIKFYENQKNNDYKCSKLRTSIDVKSSSLKIEKWQYSYDSKKSRATCDLIPLNQLITDEGTLVLSCIESSFRDVLDIPSKKSS
ncbi:MAG: hypothetical protein MHMPM18_002625 [Marteilia pararefringens]